MNKLNWEQIEFIYNNYMVTKRSVYHFTTFVCSYIHLVDKVTFESYIAFGKDENAAEYDVFHKLPYSSIREGQVIVDDLNNHWVVTWDCGEKVQLKKVEAGSDNLEENIMVYIYKGLGDMSIGYRKTDIQGKRVLDISENIPDHIEKVAYKVMLLSKEKQKNPGLMLNIPTTLAEKFGG